MRPRNRRWTRIGAYGILVDDGKMLLCRLSLKEKKSVGYWTLPGGGLEFGEHPEDAMVREVFEETGLHVKVGDLLAVDSNQVQFEDSLMHSLQIMYRAHVTGGTLTPERDGTTDECRWVTFAEAATLPLVPLARHGLELAQK